MSVRQYVGARYVPKFSDVNEGVWDDSYTYEPLTIVKHGNDYYTSKKEVPTGIAITNTEYWVLTGNYNGAISELHDEINVMHGSIMAMGGQVEDMQTTVDAVTAQNFYPEDYGAKGDGTTDDSEAINACIEAAFDARGTVVFSTKTYAIADTIDVKHPMYIDGNNAKIVAIASMTSMLDVDCLHPISEYGRGVIKDLLFDCDYKADSAITITRNINVVTFNNIQVNDALVCAFDCTSSLHATTIVVRNTDNTHLDVIGIRLNGSDNYIYEYQAVNCLKSMVINGNAMVTRNRSWNSFSGLMKNSVFAEVNAQTMFDECMVDTWAHCFTGSAGPYISNTRFFWSPEYYTDTSVGDTTTYPILFTTQPQLMNCRGHAPQGRTNKRVKFSSTPMSMIYNPEFHNVIEGLDGSALPYLGEGYTFEATIAGQVTVTSERHKRYRDALASRVIIHIEGSTGYEYTSNTPIITINSGADRPSYKATGTMTDITGRAVYPVYWQSDNNRFVVEVPSGSPIPAGHDIVIDIDYYPTIS